MTPPGRPSRPLAAKRPFVSAGTSLARISGRSRSFSTDQLTTCIMPPSSRIFGSRPTSVAIDDVAPEVAECFGSMVASDDPRHPRLRSLVDRRSRRRWCPRRGLGQTAHDALLRRFSPTTPTVGVIGRRVHRPAALQIVCDMLGIRRTVGRFSTGRQSHQYRRCGHHRRFRRLPASDGNQRLRCRAGRGPPRPPTR